MQTKNNLAQLAVVDEDVIALPHGEGHDHGDHHIDRVMEARSNHRDETERRHKEVVEVDRPARPMAREVAIPDQRTQHERHGVTC